MDKEIKRRRPSIENKTKRVKSVSFSGDEGYEALDILDNNNHTLGNSGLIIDLLRIYNAYKKSVNLDNDDDVIFKLKNDLDVK